MNCKIFRPKGRAYILYNAFKYAVLAGLLCYCAFSLSYENAFATGETDKLITFSFVVFLMMLLVALIAIQTCDLIRYRIVLYNQLIYVAVKRSIFFIWLRDIKISYFGIKELQYKKIQRRSLSDIGNIMSSVICITKDGAKEKEYIFTKWFSKKQIDAIMKQISINAEKINSFPCNILPDDIT